MTQTAHQARQFRYYELVMAAFVVVLICSNLIGPAKIAQIDLPLLGVVTFGAGGSATTTAAMNEAKPRPAKPAQITLRARA